MVGSLVLISLAIAACQADNPVTPPIRCGYLPNHMYPCIGSPKVVKSGISAQCDNIVSQCDKVTCIFKKSGWMDGDKLDKQKMAAHFDQFAKDNPEWQAAVDNLKTTCLTADIPPQGIYLNCPAYDAMQCTFASFIRKAQPSQWSTASTCEYAHQFAASCPICPADCFAASIPIGSCNACLSLPRSP